MTNKYDNDDLHLTRAANVLIAIAENHKDEILALKARDRAKAEKSAA